jgi:hypothetical protein
MYPRVLFLPALLAICFTASAQAPQATDSTAAASVPMGVNLLSNPGAEATDMAEQAVWGGAEHWTTADCAMNAEPYGASKGVFVQGWGEKNAHGTKLFRFTCAERKEVRTLVQHFDLTPLADTLDQGRVVGRITGHMASIGNDGLRGNVVVEYRNADDKTTMTLRTANTPCAIKGDAWKLTRCAQSGVIPAGTRHAVVYLTMTLDPNAKPGGSFVMDDASFELFYR